MFKAIVVITILFASIPCLPADSTTKSDPDSVVQAYLSALENGDWHGAADCFLPEELGALKQMMANAFAQVPDTGSSEIFPRMSTFFCEAKSRSELLACDSVSFMAGLFDLVAAVSPEMGDLLRSARGSVVGTLNEGDSLRHFVYRVTMASGDIELSSAELLTTQRIGDQWYLHMKQDMQKMVVLVERMVQSMQSANPGKR